MRYPEPTDWHAEKTYESMITYGTNAIKFVLLANGGAVLSILTFLGNHSDKIAGVKCAITYFVVGVILGGVANMIAYITQLTLFNQRDEVGIYRDHRTWLYLTMLALVLGIICFAAGSLQAINGLSG